MLYLLTHLGGARAEGLEPNRGYARHAREHLALPVHEGFVERSAQIGGDYDLITIHHVLEHLADPRMAMRILHGWLRPGGHLVVEVPNVRPPARRRPTRFTAPICSPGGCRPWNGWAWRWVWHRSPRESPAMAATSK